MTVLPARHWRCPRCGWEYDSPVAVHGVGCPHHKGGPVVMRAVDGENHEKGGRKC